jgi:hypothetical protein
MAILIPTFVFVSAWIFVPTARRRPVVIKMVICWVLLVLMLVAIEFVVPLPGHSQ